MLERVIGDHAAVDDAGQTRRESWDCEWGDKRGVAQVGHGHEPENQTTDCPAYLRQCQDDGRQRRAWHHGASEGEADL